MDTRELPISAHSLKKDGTDEISDTPRSLEFRVLPEIDNTNKNFKGQQKNELVLCFCRRHPIVLLPLPIVFFTIFGLISATIIWRQDIGFINGYLGFAMAAAATYFLHHFFLRIFNYYLQTIIITNFRIIELQQTLFFTSIRNSIDLREIQDIEIHQKGITKTLLNYGELKITLSSVHATKVFRHVPNPEYHFRKINKTKREYIHMRRLEKP